MKVVVTGATGNVGTSVLHALNDAQEVTEIAGIARRRPAVGVPKTVWVQQDVARDDLHDTFEGADVVIHLAWAIQPSRDENTLRAINVAGSERVFRAVADPWPETERRSSFSSRHKALVEELLDEVEEANPGMRVVRLRPALIFKGDAASEIRRLFAEPFLPGFLVNPRLIPFAPRIPGLRFQAVHSLDVGDAYRRAAVTDIRA